MQGEYLRKVEIQEKDFEQYRGVIKEELYAEIKSLSEALKNKKICFISATPSGGGVAEILQSLVPLFASLGIGIEWRVFNKDGVFFKVTRKLHDYLQGGAGFLSTEEKDLYLEVNQGAARELADSENDVFLIHDPQPLPIGYYLDDRFKKIFHLHLDISNPNEDIIAFLKQYFYIYQRFIVSLPSYLEKNEFIHNGVVIPPAIDPLDLKNQNIPYYEAAKVVRNLGINTDKNILLQVLRFDRWKDPQGTVEVHRILKNKFSDLQTALVGFNIAQDDPVAEKVYREISSSVKGDEDIFVFYNLSQAKGYSIDEVVRAFYTCATVDIQKSIREGFGLVVTEAMWKKKAVIGGNVGGIKYQIQDGINGFLVNNVQEAVERIEKLFSDEMYRQRIGEAAQNRVKDNFLIPRMLKDYLSVIKDVL